MSAIKIALQQSQKRDRRKTSEAMSAEVSPDSKCPICLDIFNNISYLDPCLHKFCFRCIHEWSKNKPECPLCKQPFNSIYHSIKSEHDFKKYDLQPVDNGSFGTFGGVRFRYRTTLTGVHRQMQGERRQMQGRTSPPPDNGVMFEASNSTQQRQDRYIRRMMMRLAAKRRAAIEGRAVQSIREQEMVNFRRELYRQGVRVRTVRDGGRCRDTSAEFYRRNPACLHRLVPWLKRELVVLYGAHGSLVNIVQHIIMSRITRYDMEDVTMQEELRPFLQGRTEHFLHEFISFAKAPFNMDGFDQNAVYDCPAPSSNEDSSSNSSVIAISEDEENFGALEPPRTPGYTTSTPSHSMWDDETPGPSYSTTAEQPRTERLSVQDSESDSSLEEDGQEFGATPQQLGLHNNTDLTQGDLHNEDCLSSETDDCVIVGFVKPTAERTPELVQLSSDSDESLSDDTKEVPLLPQHIRFTSCSPSASQSSDLGAAGLPENMEMTDYNHFHSKEKSRRHKTSGKSESKVKDHYNSHKIHDSISRTRERHRSKDRNHRRRRRSRSGDRRSHSRSPMPPNREIGDFYFSGWEITSSNYTSKSKRKESDFSYDTSPHSYQSYNYYRRERDDSGMYHTKRHSHYHRSQKRSCSPTRSHSRESRRRDKSRSPSNRKCHQDKPGGKRKYKTRHLEESSDILHPSAFPEDNPLMIQAKHKKSKEKHRKKSKERSKKHCRSLSVELVHTEESYSDRGRHRHKKKKKHKKKSKRHKSIESTERRSPTVITIDSDSDHFANDTDTQASTSKRDHSVNNATDASVAIAPPKSAVS